MFALIENHIKHGPFEIQDVYKHLEKPNLDYFANHVLALSNYVRAIDCANSHDEIIDEFNQSLNNVSSLIVSNERKNIDQLFYEQIVENINNVCDDTYHKYYKTIKYNESGRFLFNQRKHMDFYIKNDNTYYLFSVDANYMPSHIMQKKSHDIISVSVHNDNEPFFIFNINEYEYDYYLEVFDDMADNSDVASKDLNFNSFYNGVIKLSQSNE